MDFSIFQALQSELYLKYTRAFTKVLKFLGLNMDS